MADTEMVRRFSCRAALTWRSAVGPIMILTIGLAIFAAIDKGFYIIVTTIVTGGMWALMAMGLALLFGVMNIPNFAHGEFFMIGSLSAYFVFSRFENYVWANSDTFWAAVIPLIALFTAAAVGAVVGVVVEFLVFRPLRRRTREQWVMNSFVITVGVSVILINSHQIIFGPDFKGIVNYWLYPPISFYGASVNCDRLLMFALALLIMFAFWMFMKFSLLGRAIRAVSQDEKGAVMVGIDLDNIQTFTMALCCSLAALAGACLLFMFPAYPTSGLGPLYNSFFVIVVMGLGNVGGAVWGGFIVALLQTLTAVYVGEGWGYVIPSAMIIILLIFKPSGILGSEVKGILER